MTRLDGDEQTNSIDPTVYQTSIIKKKGWRISFANITVRLCKLHARHRLWERSMLPSLPWSQLESNPDLLNLGKSGRKARLGTVTLIAESFHWIVILAVGFALVVAGNEKISK